MAGRLVPGDFEVSAAQAWTTRDARGAEERLEARTRGPLAGAAELRENPHLEMHTRGG